MNASSIAMKPGDEIVCLIAVHILPKTPDAVFQQLLLLLVDEGSGNDDEG
jgi:hypothetical protein